MKNDLKKTIALVCLLLTTVISTAQTNFRSLSFEQALDAAKKENKLVFIDFYTTWCGPCKQMARNVFPQTKVGDFVNPRLVAIKLDAEKEGKDYAKLFNVRAYPTYVICTPEKKLVNSFSGSMSAEDFIAKLTQALDPELEKSKVIASFKSGDRRAKVVQAYTDMIMATANRANAALKYDTIMSIINTYVESLSSADRMKPENYFIYRNYSRDLKGKAFTFLADNLSGFPKEDQKELTAIVKDDINYTCMQYMMNRMDEPTMSIARKYISALSLADETSQGRFFRFMQEYDASTAERLMATSEKSFDYITDTLTLQSFWFNFSTHFNGKDQSVRNQAADYLEKQIPRIPAMKGLDFSEIVEQLRKPWVDPKALEAKINANEKNTQEGNVAPAFMLKDLDGKTFDSSKLKGKYYVLDFWATWCKPCMMAMPHVKEMNDKYKDTGKLVVIGINCDKNADKVKSVVAKNNMDWLQLLSKNKETDYDLADVYGIKYLPTLIIVSPEGKIVKRLVNDKEALFNYIDSVMK